MKFRKLRPRGIVRYFRDDTRHYLWIWKSGKMTYWPFGAEHTERVNSVRMPEHQYHDNFREITLAQARRSFRGAFPP